MKICFVTCLQFLRLLSIALIFDGQYARNKGIVLVKAGVVGIRASNDVAKPMWHLLGHGS